MQKNVFWKHFYHFQRRKTALLPNILLFQQKICAWVRAFSSSNSWSSYIRIKARAERCSQRYLLSFEWSPEQAPCTVFSKYRQTRFSFTRMNQSTRWGPCWCKGTIRKLVAVQYASLGLTKSERTYSIFEKSSRSHLGVENIQHHLHGGSFVPYSNHNGLWAAFENVDSRGRLVGWLCIMAEYDLRSAISNVDKCACRLPITISWRRSN